MYAAIAMLVVSSFPFPTISYYATTVVEKLIKTLNFTVRRIEQIPFASIDNVQIHPQEAFGFYLIIMLWLCYLQFRKAKYLMGILICVLIINSFWVLKMFICF
jgi:competence protein ComEC